MKTILDLTSTKALDYFLQSSNYCTLPLPKYFNFDKILNYVRNVVGAQDLIHCLENSKNKPSDYEGVNHSLLFNKDGRYAFRHLQLANPFLYYFLVREITTPSNWSLIKKRFESFQKDSIEVVSIPCIKRKKDKNVTATSIKSWWEHIEQRSIELSLEYKYIFITDITNCYSSIYTHSIAWALHGVEYAKSNKQDSNLGNNIDRYIRGMQYGQTNGIPQGSVLFDFIAEIILGYSDSLLSQELIERGITSYKILRYRDDYRIFSNSKEELEIIAMSLQSVLSQLNFQLNSSKTLLSEDVIESSIKSDKLYYIANRPNLTKKGVNSIQHELLYILQFSKKYPNSGTLYRLLTSVLKHISAKKDLKENICVLSAIIVEIAMNSPKIYSLAVSILSNLIIHLKDATEREKIAKNICIKFYRLPNIGYLQLWMQRITVKMKTSMNYSEPLCALVEKQTDVQIWNNNWLRQDIIADFPQKSICSNLNLSRLTPKISIKEVSIFDY